MEIMNFKTISLLSAFTDHGVGSLCGPRNGSIWEITNMCGESMDKQAN